MATPDRYIVDLAGTKKTSFKVGSSFALLTSRNINTAAGELTGGGDLSADRTLGLANTAVAPATYGSASVVPEITVDAKGRITAAVNRTITPGGIGASALGHTHATSDIINLYQYGITGVKSLTGGGTLAADRTMELVNDAASPGTTQYYGTNGSGTKGWFSLLGQNLVGLETSGITGLLTLTKAGSTPRTLTAPDATGTIRLVEDLYASLAFDTGAGAPSYGEGKLYWDNNDHTLAVMTEVNGVTVQVGQEEVVRARNQTGSTITNGQVVYVNGASGSRPTVALALATSTLSDKVIGICTYDIAHNAVGYITRGGLVRDVDTFAWAEGTELYVSDSVAGGLTSTPPVAPNHAVRVGVVLYSHSSNGIIMVHVDTGNSLNDLHDVHLSAPADKNALRYVTANTRWENTNQGAWLDTAQSFSALQTLSAGAIVSDLTSTYMVVAGASGRLQNSAIIQGSITGAMTISKSGTTARAYTFPDAAIVMSGSAVALTSGRVPYVTTGGLLTDSATLTFGGSDFSLAPTDATVYSSSAAQGDLGARYVVNNLNNNNDRIAQIVFRQRNSATYDSSIGASGGSSAFLFFKVLGTERFSISSAAIAASLPVTCSSTLSCTSLTASGLTSGRVPYVSTGGLLIDSAALLFSGTLLTYGDGTGSPSFVINGAAGNVKNIRLSSAGSRRWEFGGNNVAESGANAGTPWIVAAYSDTGSFIDIPLTILRAAGGAITLARPVTCSSTLSATSLTATGLTISRVPFSGVGGLLQDSDLFTFSTTAGLAVKNTTAGATSLAQIFVENDAAVGFNVRSYSSASTTTRYGITLANWALLEASGGSNAGVVIGSIANVPVVFGQNNAERFRFNATAFTSLLPITVPNGTAAAPGIRTTANAHGLYDAAATSLGLAVAGISAALIGAPNGTTYGGSLQLRSPSAGEVGAVFNGSRSDGAVYLSGSNGYAGGGGVRLFGNTHASKANYVEFTRGNTVSAYFDGSGGLTCVGTVTVPNGTAAAPGLRVTSEASGLFRASSATLGVATAGAHALTLGGPGGTFGAYIGFLTPSAAEYSSFFNSRTDTYMAISGGTGPANSGNIRIYGSTHATKVSYIEFLRANTVSAYFDGSGVFTLNTTTDATTLGTAAVVALGGLSVAKNIIGGQALNLGSIASTQIQSTAGRILLSSSATDVTSKATFILNAHYTNAEEPFGTILASSNAATNLLMLGGGSASYNAATSVAIYTGATSTTVTGTDRFNVDSTGIITISNTTNATTVSDGSVRFAGGISVAAGKDIVGGGLFKSISGSNYIQLGAAATSIVASNGTQTATLGMAAANDGIATGSLAGDIVLSAPTASARILISAGRLVLLDTTDATTTTDGSLSLPGGISCAKSFVSTASSAGAHYWGPSGTDGSVRVYGNGSGALVVEKRVSGSWTEIGRFA